MKRSMENRALWLVTACVLCAPPWNVASAQTQPPQSCEIGRDAYSAIDPLFDTFMREQHVPGVVYGIVHQGKLVHCRTAGVREVTSQEPVTFDTLFRIASMTKSFTALAVLKLRDAGKLSLDAPATQWIPQLASSRYETADTRPIRIRDLLAHSAGFVTDDPWGDRQLDMSDERLLQIVAAGIPLARMPGMAHEYSNYGYALLGRAVTVASGTRYQDYVRREILLPLGMSSSGWEASAIEPSRRAIGYRYEDASWREEPVLADGAFSSMGGLHTSARDYTAYIAFLLNAWTDRNPADARILSKASRRELAQASAFPALIPADPADPTSCAAALVYGFGVRIHNDCRFRHAFAHSGGLPGYGSYMLVIPEYDIGLFAFANRTYAPASVVVKQAAARLYDSGAMQKVTVRRSSALTRIEQAVAQMYAAGSVNAIPGALADNLLLDRSAEKRDQDLAALRAKLGACRADSEMDVRHSLSAVLKYPCERGRLVATVLLAPIPEPSVQKLDFAASQ